MTKQRVLVVIPNRCTGCVRCEMHCSFFHTKSIDPTQRRLFVIRAEPDIDTPVICTQCGLCMAVCPIPGAMVRNRKTGAIEVTEKCTGCGQCVPVCPYGVISVHKNNKKAIKCDLCGGDPACVKGCPFNVIEYADQERANSVKRLIAATAVKGAIYRGPKS